MIDRNYRKRQKMSSKNYNYVNSKQLMKIIYQKEQQVEKYRRRLREKEGKCDCHEIIERIITSEQKQSITRYFEENRDFFRTANQKIGEMDYKILTLQSQLQKEENQNQQLEKQISQLQRELSDRDKSLLELEMYQKLAEKSQHQLKQGMDQIQSLKLENSKSKLLAEQFKQQNESLNLKMQEIDYQISKSLRLLSKSFNRRAVGTKSKENLAVGSSNFLRNGGSARSQKKILSQQFIAENVGQESGEKTGTMNLYDKIKRMITLLKEWQDSLIMREEDFKNQFEKSICEHSFEGVSHLLSQAQMPSPSERVTLIGNDQILETSEYRRNQEQFLKELEEDCQRDIPGREYSDDKQKIIQLDEVKQTLQLTKQINETLFQQLSQQQKTIKVFKDSFQNLDRKKLLRSIDATQEVRNLKAVLCI